MAREHARLFESSPDWLEYLSRNPALRRHGPTPPLNILASRAQSTKDEDAWFAAHPPKGYGYVKTSVAVPIADGSAVAAAIYLPENLPTPALPLPILFVTHGGGWVQGSPITDERWMLASLLRILGPAIAAISIDYRLAPEFPFPKQEEECWNALQAVTAKTADILGPAADGSRIIITGTSAGGILAAKLALRARDAGMEEVIGVVLNVPVLCHPDMFPPLDLELNSYTQCSAESVSKLTGEHMRQLWESYVPAAMHTGAAEASPLLKNVRGLKPHAIFVAGQDPLRDEALAYAEKLRQEGIDVELRVYPGVPHDFGKFWELETTKRFQQHLSECVHWIIKSANKF